jgi:hypothetical protein
MLISAPPRTTNQYSPTKLLLACAECRRILDTLFFSFPPHLIKIQSLQPPKPLQRSKPLNHYISSSYYLIKIMIASLSSFIQFKIVRYLLLHWRSNAIAAEVHCHVCVIYKIQANLFIYEQLIRPQIHIKDASRRICKSVEDALIHYLENQP